jgi:glycerol kinase
LLLDLASGAWDDFMLERLRIPRAVLPQVVRSSLGRTAPVGTLGGSEVPITGIAGDQQAALFGQACFEPGMAKNTYGTGCFLLLNTGDAPLVSANRLLSTIAWHTDARRCYALEGAVFVGGAVVQWLRDGLGFVERSADVEALAASVPDTGGTYFVPAFTGLGSPHWDASARGTIVGLSRGTTRGHIARAALESIAFQSAEVLLAMQKDAQQPLREVRVDGGATANDLLMQFQADLLGVPVVRPEITETTALGAAYLAGLGAGFWRSKAEVAANWRAECRFEPTMSRDEARGRLERWSQAVTRSLGWHVEDAS